MDNSPEGITNHDYNYLKCWVALIKHGKVVFQQIFSWGYHGKLEDIKNDLLKLPSYTNAQYRRDFNSLQRQKIESGNVENFDLTLYYDLLQKLSLPSNLRGHEADCGSLPNILYQIKMKRNQFAHSKLELCDEKMIAEIDELIFLFHSALGKAGSLYNIDPKKVQGLVNKLASDLQIIKISNISEMSLVQHKMAIAKEKYALVLTLAKDELFKLYKSFSKVPLAVRSPGERFGNITDIFVNPVLQKTTTDILFRQIEHSNTFINFEDLLSINLEDGSVPNFIVLLSQSGMGKTTIAKYIIHSWVESIMHVKGVEDLDLIIYIDCRNATHASLENLFLEILPRTSQIFDSTELKSLIMSRTMLFILDNFDEMSETVAPTIEELMKLNSDRVRIIATSKQMISVASKHKNSSTSVQLHLQGIATKDILTCLSKICSTFHGTIEDEHSLEAFSLEYIERVNCLECDYKHSPEALSHLLFHWLNGKSSATPCTTTTQLFLVSHALLLEKIADMAGLRNSAFIYERHKLNEKLKCFFRDVYSLAFFELEIAPCVKVELLENLTQRLRVLNLPHEFVIPEIFCLLETIDGGLTSQLKVTFPSVSTQVFYSSLYLVQVIEENETISLCDIISKSLLQPRKLNNLRLLLKNSLGIIITKNIPNMECRIREIFQLINQHCSTTTELWLDIIQECHCDEHIITEARKHMGSTWIISDKSINATLIRLIKSGCPPEVIDITCSTNTEAIHELKTLMEVCALQKHLKMSLKLYYHFWVEKCLYSDQYLSEVAKHVKLDQFAGRLSANVLPLLPSTLTRLALHIKPEDIEPLNTRLIELKCLQMLYLNFNIEVDYPTIDITRLKVPNRETLLCVDLWNIEESLIEWITNVISALSPCYCRLTLRKTKLKPLEARRCLESLREKRIHVDTFTIGSVVSITESEAQELKQLANSFQCMEFKWLVVI